MIKTYVKVNVSNDGFDISIKMNIYKCIFTKKDYFNISYKKALRLLKKSTRKMFLNSVKHWENQTGYSKYKAYFHRNRNLISFTTAPFIPDIVPDPEIYFGPKL